jgi:hypothetical protein
MIDVTPNKPNSGVPIVDAWQRRGKGFDWS